MAVSHAIGLETSWDVADGSDISQIFQLNGGFVDDGSHEPIFLTQPNLENTSEAKSCKITIHFRANAQISRVVLLSHSRIVEFYGNAEEYLSTVRSSLIETGNNQMYRIEHTSSIVCESLTLKLLSLVNKQSVEIFKLEVYATIRPHSLSSNTQPSQTANLGVLLGLLGSMKSPITSHLQHQTPSQNQNQNHSQIQNQSQINTQALQNLVTTSELASMMSMLGPLNNDNNNHLAQLSRSTPLQTDYKKEEVVTEESHLLKSESTVSLTEKERQTTKEEYVTKQEVREMIDTAKVELEKKFEEKIEKMFRLYLDQGRHT